MTSRADSELAWIERTSVLETAAPPWDALADLAGVGAASLCSLLRASQVPQGVALVHQVPAASVGLDELRAEGPLRAGYVITVALAVVDALVALHDAGLAHGGITAERVLVAPDGSVHLTGCGAAWVRPPGDAHGPRPSDDVAQVGELVRDALGAGLGPGNSGLVLVALRAGDADPLLRPDAVELRAAVLRSGRPDPLVDLLWRRRPTSGPPARGGRASLSPSLEQADLALPPGPSVTPPDHARRVELVAPESARVDPQAERASRVADPPGLADPGHVTVHRQVRGGHGQEHVSQRVPSHDPLDDVPQDPAYDLPPSRPPHPPHDVRDLRRRRALQPGRRGAALAASIGLLVVAGMLLVGLRSQPRALAADTAVLPGQVLPAPSDGASASSTPALPTPDAAVDSFGSGSGSGTGTGSGSAGSPMTAASSADVDSHPVPGSSGPSPPADASDGVPSVLLDRGDTAPDWVAVLAGLDAGRRAAIGSGSTQELARWVDPDGAAWKADSALALRVRRLGAALVGGALEVLDLRTEEVSGASTVLLVRDRRAAYTIALPGSATPVAVPARGPRWWRVRLRLDGARWRVRAVTGIAAPAGASPTSSPGATTATSPTSRAP